MGQIVADQFQRRAVILHRVDRQAGVSVDRAIADPNAPRRVAPRWPPWQGWARSRPRPAPPSRPHQRRACCHREMSGKSGNLGPYTGLLVVLAPTKRPVAGYVAGFVAQGAGECQLPKAAKSDGAARPNCIKPSFGRGRAADRQRRSKRMRHDQYDHHAAGPPYRLSPHAGAGAGCGVSGRVQIRHDRHQGRLLAGLGRGAGPRLFAV